MSEKVSKALISMLNELSDTESDLSKVEAAVFVKKSNYLIEEKVSYLYKLLQAEANSYGQNSDIQLDKIKKITTTYREKMNMIYNEFYLQYANIQNEIGDARLNQKAMMINYQKAINDIENGKEKNDDLKNRIKRKNNIYEEILNKCEKQISMCTSGFEDEINKNFLIETNLQTVNENNIFQKIRNKFLNLISGNKRYAEALEFYKTNVDNIDAKKISNDLREQTIDFITDILEKKKVELSEA